MPIRVVSADSQPIVNIGVGEVLRQYEDIDLVGTAIDSEGILELAAHHTFDVLVTDSHAIRARLDCCQSVIPLIRLHCPELRIVAHGGMSHLAQLAAMERRGINVLLHRNDTVRHLADAVNAAYIKARYFSPSLAHAQPAACESNRAHPALTRREREVLALLLSGRTVCEVANAIHRCKQTISAHKARAMAKLGVARDADLFRLAYEDGFLAFCLSPQDGDRLCVPACRTGGTSAP
ncbi:response regulator transcription factor [Trinickia caryophylli]|uniref:Two-component system, NarL family, captular synthesis response regulator RcsB n=1 Tax=Trinickia caryophylli TaxID=28094 RepID=A0A1X7H4S5_TRICW|nr:response regulator transcription factor [Trinickia caryophylli]PMS08828.1 DNA-binding response regulator [Trinickia caryophylli]TRX17319.1 response regulator transcription factor [Trinickia caryophylli]WQE11941.1 response regulator transcription factor [Trinickia caryophylli]SMF79371.1 two-component system, NarL family, captular synthesis response regulator RcsB [Trinickia caryophylli]GLU35669.1 DNA-binding response regulator [Trinickia caryophylli]